MGSFGQPDTGAKVDVYFLADSTGSMGTQLKSVKKSASSIMEQLRAAGTDVQFGVGNYKDFSDGGKATAFTPQQSVTADRGSVIDAISDWKHGGGGENDRPEAQLYALDHLATSLATIGWRPGAQRIVVWFGDAPGHDPICTAISGLPYDITEDSVTQKLKEQRIRVVALSTPSGLDDDPRESASGYVSQCGEPGGKPGQASRITAATGGSHTSGVDADEIADTIVREVSTQISGGSMLDTLHANPFIISVDDKRLMHTVYLDPDGQRDSASQKVQIWGHDPIMLRPNKELAKLLQWHIDHHADNTYTIRLNPSKQNALAYKNQHGKYDEYLHILKYDPDSKSQRWHITPMPSIVGNTYVISSAENSNYAIIRQRDETTDTYVMVRRMWGGPTPIFGWYITPAPADIRDVTA